MNKNNSKTVLVTGATGHQGGAALRHLRERGFPVRAVTRDPDQPVARKLFVPGTEIVRGDQTDAPSIARALDGVYGVFSVQNSKDGFESEVRQGSNMVDTASRAAVDYFVYSSVGSADRNTGIPHFDSKFQVEQHLRNSGLRYSILRPVFFMENLLWMLDSIQKGTFNSPLKPETRLQVVAVDDIGAFAAMAFQHTGHWANRTIELAGDELSMQQIAEAVGRAAGHSLQYVQTPWDEFEKQSGKEMTTMYRWFESEGYHVDIPEVRREHPGLLTLEHWLTLHWPASEP